MNKELLTVIAFVLTFYAFYLYIRTILDGRTHPHVFSWLIWGIITSIVFVAQLADGGGMGAWPMGVSGLITLGIAGMAYMRRADISITRADWVFFLLALSSIPIWVLTDNPLWSVILLTLIDLLGFIPTFRKTYYAPFSEPLTFAGILAVRNGIIILALEHYSVTTVLFPAAVGGLCIMFMIVIGLRRYRLRAC